MKKKIKNHLIVFQTIAIVLAVIAFILSIIYSFQSIRKHSKKEIKEHFKPIAFKNDLYLTEEVLDKIQKNDSSPFDLGAANVCIFKDDVKFAGEVTTPADMECISLGELGIARNMPKARRDRVCIDEECLEKIDLKMLTGKHPFRLSHNKRGDEITGEDKCVQLGYTKAQTCNNNTTYIQSKYEEGIQEDGIPTLILDDCSKIDNNDKVGAFTLHPSNPLLDVDELNAMADDTDFTGFQLPTNYASIPKH